jgi:hypothetical protein
VKLLLVTSGYLEPSADDRLPQPVKHEQALSLSKRPRRGGDLTPARRFATAWVMPRLPAERSTLFGRTLGAPRKRSAIALANVQIVIDVPVKALRPVIPRSGSDKHAARKPFGSVIAIRSAGIRRGFVIAVWAYRRPTDTNSHAGSSATSNQNAGA